MEHVTMSSVNILTDTHIGKEVPDELAFPALLQELLRRSKRTSTGCLEWTGWRTATGYGVRAFRGRGQNTHRLMYMAVIGAIPDGMQILHSCDNPPCMNPRHLSLGTGQKNMQESVERGRHYEAVKPNCDRGHPLSGANLYVCKDERRHCRTCQRARQRMRLGWPEDLAYSVPRKQGWPPKDLVRIEPKKTRKQLSAHCSKGHELSGRNRYVTPKGNVECRTCRQLARNRYGEKQKRHFSGEGKG